MSTKSSFSPEPLRLELKPSRYLRIALSLLALCAVMAILHSALNIYVRCSCVVFLLLHWRALLQRHAQSPGCLLWQSDTWLWSGATHENLLTLRHATVWPGLIVLRFCEEGSGKTRVFSLLPDNLTSDMQRRLRMHLRHMPVFGDRVD
ncbi:MAG TPA: protein YgfX [Spongiibacteraceae bacterium]|nr:protein YgfX [Spongiibacteraceae bacterium]